ncbi:DUF7848 domain-containing protein [Streptomyces hesseae]|uniref:DUF7848 domain-containing protein n=1 Tax=Streptomyces hesseae TaxID=3075519 RepID=UPI003F68A004
MLRPLNEGPDLLFHLAECWACQQCSEHESDANDADLWAAGHVRATGHQDFRIAAIRYTRAQRVDRTPPDRAENVG